MQLLEEHRARADAGIAVEELEAAARLAREHGAEDRQDRRDAAAGREGHAVRAAPPAAQRRCESCRSASGPRRVADRQTLCEVTATRAAAAGRARRCSRSARPARSRSNTCAAPLRAIERSAKRHVLARLRSDSHRADPAARRARAARPPPPPAATWSAKSQQRENCRATARAGSGSDALEVVEGLETVCAAIVRLAGRRAEFAHALRSSSIRSGQATMAGQQSRDSRRLRRRRDAVVAQLFAARRADPVAGPRRREHVVHARAARCPAAAGRATMSRRITAVAGQPE